MALSSTFMASQEDVIDAVLLLWPLDYKHIHFLSLLLLALRSGGGAAVSGQGHLFITWPSKGDKHTNAQANNTESL